MVNIAAVASTAAPAQPKSLSRILTVPNTQGVHASHGAIISPLVPKLSRMLGTA
jgi:hypothetical protein